jgi:hypothetical protein
MNVTLLAIVVHMLRGTWEFFHSILGDSVFAKLVAGALALVIPVLFVGNIVRNMASEPASKKPRNPHGIEGKLYALEMRISQFFRDLIKR